MCKEIKRACRSKGGFSWGMPLASATLWMARSGHVFLADFSSSRFESVKSIKNDQGVVGLAVFWLVRRLHCCKVFPAHMWEELTSLHRVRRDNVHHKFVSWENIMKERRFEWEDGASVAGASAEFPAYKQFSPIRAGITVFFYGYL